MGARLRMQWGAWAECSIHERNSHPLAGVLTAWAQCSESHGLALAKKNFPPIWCKSPRFASLTTCLLGQYFTYHLGSWSKKNGHAGLGLHRHLIAVYKVQIIQTSTNSRTNMRTCSIYTHMPTNIHVVHNCIHDAIPKQVEHVQQEHGLQYSDSVRWVLEGLCPLQGPCEATCFHKIRWISHVSFVRYTKLKSYKQMDDHR